MKRIVGIIAFLLAIAFSSEVMGYHARPFNTAFCLVFVGIFLLAYLRNNPNVKFNGHWPGFVLTTVSLVGVFCSVGWVGVLFISLLIGGLRLLFVADEYRAEFDAYQITAFSYGLFLWFWRETAAGWYVVDGIARAFMWVTQHLGLKANLGPTAMGIPIIVLLLTYGIVRTKYSSKNRVRTIINLSIALLVIQIVFITIYDAAVASLSISFLMRQPQGNVFWYPFSFVRYLYPNNMQGIVFLLSSAAVLYCTRGALQIQGKKRMDWLQGKAIFSGAFAILVGAALAGYVPPRSAAHGNILLSDSGYINFNVPVYGSYGHKSGGMFGRLAGFLKANGYHVKLGSVSGENLKNSDVLVIINPLDKFDRTRKKAIWNFVYKGGSLLVLGDHTALHNIREPINDLLNPMNIEINFDSATPFGTGWLWGYSLPRHAINRGISYSNSKAQIWIGASLTISPPARPVIIGSYGFSDAANMANIQDGHLGNLTFDFGEKLGDLPLVADCNYGKGKVLVFGDTSSLQNDALVSSYEFIGNIFAWLTNSKRPIADFSRECLAAILIVAGMLILVMRAPVNSKLSIAGAAFLLGWAIGGIPAIAFEASNTARNEIVWIDASHRERFNINNMWIDESIGGLTFNLMRNGFSPQLMQDWDTSALKRGSVLIIIAPTEPFSSSDTKVIKQFVKNGGHLILASGWEDSWGSSELWHEFGLKVQQRPLGRVLVKQPGGDVRLYRGWSIEVLRGNPEILCSPWGYPAIVKMQYGNGSVVAIADTQFLFNRNVEGSDQYCLENIEFLHRLFSQLKKNQTSAFSGIVPKEMMKSRTDASSKGLPAER